MKNLLLKLVYILAGVTVLFNTAFSVKNNLFSDINDLPKGELIATEKSPFENCTVKVYRVSNVLGNAVRAELIRGDKNKGNFFWLTGSDTTNVFWVKKGSVQFDNILLPTDGSVVYDCRRGTAIFTTGIDVTEYNK